MSEPNEGLRLPFGHKLLTPAIFRREPCLHLSGLASLPAWTCPGSMEWCLGIQKASASSLEGTVALKTIRGWFCTCSPDPVTGTESAPEMALTPVLFPVAHSLVHPRQQESSCVRGRPSGAGVRNLPTGTMILPVMKNDSSVCLPESQFSEFSFRGCPNS